MSGNNETVQIYFDGNVIHDLKSFYDEADRKLTDGFKSGHNLDAFNDLLRGGFGVFDNEHVDLHWTQFQKSSATLPQRDLRIILEIIDERLGKTLLEQFPVVGEQSFQHTPYDLRGRLVDLFHRDCRIDVHLAYLIPGASRKEHRATYQYHTRDDCRH